MEERVCIGCQKEHRELQAYARQEAIDAYQIGRRVTAVTHGQARRFMGRFSGKLGRFR